MRRLEFVHVFGSKRKYFLPASFAGEKPEKKKLWPPRMHFNSLARTSCALPEARHFVVYMAEQVRFLLFRQANPRTLYLPEIHLGAGRVGGRTGGWRRWCPGAGRPGRRVGGGGGRRRGRGRGWGGRRRRQRRRGGGGSLLNSTLWR